MFSPVPTSGVGNWDQLLPSQCSAPVLTPVVTSGSFFIVLPTTHMSLLAMVVIAEGLRRCSLLATVLQEEGSQTRPFAPGPTINSERLAAKSPTNGASRL